MAQSEQYFIVPLAGVPRLARATGGRVTLPAVIKISGVALIPRANELAVEFVTFSPTIQQSAQPESVFNLPNAPIPDFAAPGELTILETPISTTFDSANPPVVVA